MSSKDNRRTATGTVISDTMAKTVKVAVTRQVQHPVFKKYIKKTSNILAHDEKEEASTGDVVMIKETRPISKRKRWMVVRIVKKGLDKKDLLNDGSENNDTAADKA